MQNNVESDFQGQLDAVFARLNPQAVEEFYTSYQQWSQQQGVHQLRQRIETVRAQQVENEQRLREVQPSAIALAALARLQSNGVSDIALLDAMLERGESWLDQTMQRLDYFEQFDDFISDDYTKWCQGALEGAFDWIDSVRDETNQAPHAQVETSPVESPLVSEDATEVEALFLQRLATEREDDLAWQEATTLKRPAVQPSAPEIVSSAPVEQEQPAQEAGELPDAEEQIVPEEASPVEDSALSVSEPDQPALLEFAPPAPSEAPAPEEPSEPEAEQIVPLDVPAQEEAGHNEGNEPREMEMSAPAEVTSNEQQAVSTSEPIRPVRNASRKRGVIGTLIWILTGK